MFPELSPENAKETNLTFEQSKEFLDQVAASYKPVDKFDYK